MGYKLLGFVVWKAAKLYLARRVGGSGRSKALAAGGALALGAAAVAVALRRGSGE
jgi:hypothetical protein